MIFFCEHGQLGNQIFQYAALRTHGPHHKLVLFGCDRLYATFDGIEAEKYCQGYRLGYRIIKRTLPIVERVIRATRLMTLLFEFTDDSTVKLCVRPGLFGRIQFCQQAFFQSPQLFDSGLLEGLVVKPALLQAAEETLADSVALNEQPIFVHIRRGDYIRWPSREHSAILPLTWYRERVAEMQSLVQNPRFLICTDDVPYAEDFVDAFPNATITSKSPEHDFALMTLCKGGILSASSYAWWAAYFANRRAGTLPFLAPEYWAGHRMGAWFPPQIQTELHRYRKVWPNGKNATEAESRVDVSLRERA